MKDGARIHSRPLNRVSAIILALSVGVVALLVGVGSGSSAHVAAPASTPTLSRVASSSASGKGKVHRIKISKKVREGDLLVLFGTWNSSAAAQHLKGWTPVEKRRGKDLRAQAWTRDATADDAGHRVKVRLRKSAKAVVSMAAYRSTSETPQVTASVAGGSRRPGRTHKTPGTRATVPGSWLVSVWSATSAASPRWKVSAGDEVLADRASRGRGGEVSMVLADSDGEVALGRVRGRKARTKRSVASTAVFSIVVAPGTPATKRNTRPKAAFTVSCAKLACTFDGTGSADADGDALTYAWDFGDGTRGAGSTAQHAYASADTRTVTLTVSDGTATDTVTRPVKTTDPATPPGNTAPKAAFTVSCANLTCSFDGSGSTDRDGDLLTYEWDFGDGASGAGVTSQHAYTSPGTWSVTLRVSDAEASAEISKRAHTTSPNRAPTAAFTFSCADLACTFDAKNSRDLDADALTYAWDFGDDEVGAGVETSHTYATPGERIVTLTVSDGALAAVVTKSVETAVTTAPDDSVRQPVPGHERMVPSAARANMPTIDQGEIWDIAVLGDRAYIAGTFRTVTDSAGDGAVLEQAALVSYDRTTGLVDRGFRPDFGGRQVRAVEASPDGTRLFVGGTFNDVSGFATRKVASLDPATGVALPGFSVQVNAQVNALAASDTTVYIGGRFIRIDGQDMVGLAALDAETGDLDLEFDNQLSGGIGVNGALTVQQLRLTHDNARLLVVHTARKIDGRDRYGVGLIGTVSKQLLPWRTMLWEDNLQYVGGTQRIYAGDIAPDDSYFVVSSGSGGDRPPINDTAVAFSFNNGSDVQPLWVSRAFDSIYSIAISEQAVYIGGHFQWNESPTAPIPWPGLDDRGYGTGQGLSAYSLGDTVVRRDHLGALNPADGTALEWHPGSNSYEGNKAMLATEDGLLTGGDGNYQGGRRTGRVAFFDFDDLPGVSDPDTDISAPIMGRVVPTDQEFVVEGSATGSTPVTSVRVEVQSGGQYLQQDLTWSPAFFRFEAELGPPVAGVTPWTLPLTVPDSREMTIRARALTATAEDPVRAEKKIESFSFGDLPPSTRITSPGGGVQPSTSFVMRGSATDDFGVVGISLYLQSLDTDQYLTEDGELVDDYTTFRIQPDLVGSRDTTWQYDVTLPREGRWRLAAMAVDTGGHSDTRWDTRDITVSSTGRPPTLTIAQPLAVTPPVSPPPLTLPPGGPLTFSGTAIDDESLATVEVNLRNTTTRENLAADGTWGSHVNAGWHRISPINLAGTSYDWSFTMPAGLSPGSYSFEVRATDRQGLSTSRNMRGELTINVAVPGDLPPDGRLDVTGTQTLDVLHLDLTGTATDDHGVDRVLVSVDENVTDRYVQPDGTLNAAFATVEATLASPGATGTTWSLSVDLPINGDYTITAYAVDEFDQYDPSTSGAMARYRVFPGDSAPFLWENLASPPDGMAFTDGRIFVSGRAEDDIAIGEVQIAVINSMGQYLGRGSTFGSAERWNGAFLNSPGSVGSNYSYATPILPEGSYEVRVRPLDTNGQAPAPRVVNVTVSSPPDNPTPVAVGSVACAENVCTFDARESTDDDQAALTFVWDFGDGDDDDNALTTHVYSSVGEFTPTLTVSDEYGLSATLTLDPITVVEPSGNRAPTAVITTPTCIGLVCAFSGGMSRDPNVDDALSYAWSFGDGVGTGDDDGPSYTYAAAGTYTVTLTVTDNWGRTSTTTRIITVAATP